MTIAQTAALFFGGLFLANAIPHVVAGVLGRAFQSPFATPRGEGLSSSTVNVAWGFVNLVAAWLLLVPVAGFEPHAGSHMLVFGAGAFLMALFHARHFGRFHGGRAPGMSDARPPAGISPDVGRIAAAGGELRR